MRSFLFILVTLLLATYTANAQQITVTGVSNNILCYGNKFKVNFTVSPNCNPSNVFTVELSDISGNFSTAQVIGSLLGTGSGAVMCVLPTGLPPGAGYRIKVKSNDPPLSSSPNSNPLTVQNYPLPKLYSDAVTCEGGPFKLEILNDFPLPASYAWYNPNGEYIGQGAEIIINDNPKLKSGKYSVVSTYFGCISYDTTIYVIVKPRPAKPAITAEDSLCSSDTLHLSALSSTGGVSYEWMGPNGFKATTKDTIILNIGLAGQGYYKARAFFDGCPSYIDSQFVKVKLTPPVIASNNSPFCEGKFLHLSASDSTDSVQYSWIGPNGFNMNVNDTFITNAGTGFSGEYILTATLDDCMVSDTTTVLIKPYPEKPQISNNSPVCAGETLLLNATSSSAGIYKWKTPFGTMLNGPALSIFGIGPDLAGIYIVSLDLNGCVRTDTTTVIVKPVPEAPKITSNSPVFVGETLQLEIANPVANASYQWQGPQNFRDTTLKIDLSNAEENQGGLYSVTAILDGCSATSSITTEVLVPRDTGIFKLYPNPNDGNFTIEGYTLYDEEIQLVIENSIGQVIYRTTAITSNKLFRRDISITNASSGIYFLKLYSAGRKYIFPISLGKQ